MLHVGCILPSFILVKHCSETGSGGLSSGKQRLGYIARLEYDATVLENIILGA